MNALSSIDREHVIHTSVMTEMCWMNTLSSINREHLLSMIRDVSDECDDQSHVDVLRTEQDTEIIIKDWFFFLQDEILSQ